MRRLKVLSAALVTLSYWVCAACLTLVAVLVLAEIIARNVFGSSTYIQVEVSGYLIAAFTVFGAAVCIGTGKALSISLLTGLPMLRRHAGAVAAAKALCGAVILGFAGWYFWLNMLRDLRRGNSSGTLLDIALWIPESVVTTGFGVCLAIALIQVFLAEEPQAGEAE